MSRFANKRKPPSGFDYVQPTLDALHDELRTVMADSNHGNKKNEVLWPVHQINWQKTRYIYDLFNKYHRITKEVYEYCIDNKLVDAALISKWKQPGYEKLCSTYVINVRNYKYGTTSACRVPRSKLKPGNTIRDNTTGCRGCATGREGYYNIFANRYGQRLAKIQILREEMAKDSNDEANRATNTVDAIPGPTIWLDENCAKESEVRCDSENDENELGESTGRKETKEINELTLELKDSQKKSFDHKEYECTEIMTEKDHMEEHETPVVKRRVPSSTNIRESRKSQKLSDSG